MSYSRSGSFLRYLAYRVSGAIVVAVVLGALYQFSGR